MKKLIIEKSLMKRPLTKRLLFLGLTLFSWRLSISQSALAHGANIVYQTTPAIVIQATYDDGTPMANAQTVVYSPEDPEKPWLKGVTNEVGKFTFVPDRQQLGNWEVKVRQSGHGDVVTIPVEAETALAQGSSPLMGGYSWGQKWLMAIAVTWGFIGTALYFSRK